MKQFIAISFVILSIAKPVFGQNCGNAQGINLSQSPGPYTSLWPRSQGSVGTCYAHAATDLLTSFIGGGVRLNVYDAAVVSDAAADGGQPAQVMKGLIARGWACKDYGQFANLFPSQTKNILTDLMDAVGTSGMPVFYTANYESKEGAARQERIAQLAGKMAAGEIRPCGVYLDAEKGVEEFKRLQTDVFRLEDKIKVLRDEKDSFDGWFGSRETVEINKDIAELITKKNKLDIKKDKAHARYTKGTGVLASGVNFQVLDNYSEQQAAEIVFYWAEKTYPAVKQAFKDYNVSSWAPTMKQYIIGKVQRDPATGYWVAGGQYPYRLMEKLMANSCQSDNRIAISKTLKTKTMTPTKEGQARMTAKLESLLQKSPAQAIGISINASILRPDSNGGHAVNIIGCRTVNGIKEYLIHNSWGSECNWYHTRYRGVDKCQSGRVWIPASTVMNSAQEIQWLEK